MASFQDIVDRLVLDSKGGAQRLKSEPVGSGYAVRGDAPSHTSSPGVARAVDRAVGVREGPAQRQAALKSEGLQPPERRSGDIDASTEAHVRRLIAEQGPPENWPILKGSVGHIEPEPRVRSGQRSTSSHSKSTITLEGELLEQIAQNTARLAKDMRRYALGGGDLGRVGVTPVEMAAYREPVGGARGRLIVAIDEYLSYGMARHSAGLMRQGLAAR